MKNKIYAAVALISILTLLLVLNYANGEQAYATSKHLSSETIQVDGIDSVVRFIVRILMLSVIAHRGTPFRELRL
jgi:hypothetical protein